MGLGDTPMPLTDIKVRAAKAKEKAYKLSDSGGLFLLINPAGSKYWRLKYRSHGKEKLLAIGVYPEISLAEAREKRDQAKKQIANGIDPGDFKKTSKYIIRKSEEGSLEYIAREWHIKNKHRWSPNHGALIIRRLELYIFPWLGSCQISEISPPQLLEALRRVENKGALETAHRVYQICGQVFRYAVATGRANRDLTADLRGALPPTKVEHHATMIDPAKIGELLCVIDGYEGFFVTKCALRLAPLVFVRPGELRKAEWSEINLDKAEWMIPAEKMKMHLPHLVPLSTQALAILKELHPLTGVGQYVFPGLLSSKRPMSDNTVNSALKRLGYDSNDITGHGFRAMARTLLDEVLGFRPDIIEHQLAHAVKDPLGRAYNRTTHLQLRREMMQKWADYLDKLKANAERGSNIFLTLQNAQNKEEVVLI
jgi:integrase